MRKMYSHDTLISKFKIENCTFVSLVSDDIQEGHPVYSFVADFDEIYRTGLHSMMRTNQMIVVGIFWRMTE